MDPNYEPTEMETKTLYGLQLQQKRNAEPITKELFQTVVTDRKDVSYNILTLPDFPICHVEFIYDTFH